jgi:hypothetical protein
MSILIGFVDIKLISFQLPSIIGAIFMAVKPSSSKELLLQQHIAYTGSLIGSLKSFFMIIYLGVFLTKVILSLDGRLIEISKDSNDFFPALDLDYYHPQEQLYTIIICCHIAFMIFLEIINIAASIPSMNTTRRLVKVVKQIQLPTVPVESPVAGGLTGVGSPTSPPENQNNVEYVTNRV